MPDRSDLAVCSDNTGRWRVATHQCGPPTGSRLPAAVGVLVDLAQLYERVPALPDRDHPLLCGRLRVHARHYPGHRERGLWPNAFNGVRRNAVLTCAGLCV